MPQVLCHCLTCRKVTGSTYSVCLLVPEDKFKFTSGTPKQTATTHENGMGIKLSFCGDCGSPLCKVAEAEAFRGLNIVFGGTLDDQDALEKAKPGGELWIKYRPTWLSEVEGAGQMQAFS
jgi:hypothetical protein